MSTLEVLRVRIAENWSKRYSSYQSAKRAVEIGFVVFGSLIVGVSNFFNSSVGWPPSAMQLLGFLGLFLVFAGALFLVFTRTENDGLLEATKAFALAEQHSRNFQNMEWQNFIIESSEKQFRSLYLTYQSARHLLERSVFEEYGGEEELLAALVKSIRAELKIALGFETDQIWTIVIYKREKNAGDAFNFLRCVAHDRSIDCDIDKARRWKEGVGVAGIALAKNNEVVAPDILDTSAASLFSINGDILREEDRRRYRSMFAVPIQVGKEEQPWGVVIATCSDAEHFPSNDGDEDAQLTNKEGVRALAHITALALSIRSLQMRQAKSELEESRDAEEVN